VRCWRRRPRPRGDPADPPLLRERTVRRSWTGQTISLFGDQVSILALPLTAILVLHAGAEQAGYVTAAGPAPSLLFSIAAGGWVEYVDANSLFHGSRALSFVGGQSLGGILVQVATAPGAIVVDAVSYPGIAQPETSGTKSAPTIS
jgi:hypothetical protein